MSRKSGCHAPIQLVKAQFQFKYYYKNVKYKHIHTYEHTCTYAHIHLPTLGREAMHIISGILMWPHISLNLLNIPGFVVSRFSNEVHRVHILHSGRADCMKREPCGHNAL